MEGSAEAQLEVPEEHRKAIPEMVVSPHAGAPVSGRIASMPQKQWTKAMREVVAALAPVLEPDERVLAACPAIRSLNTKTLVLSLGFAGMYQRRHFLAVTDRRLLVLGRGGGDDPTKVIKVADPRSEIEVLSFGPSMVKRDPQLVLRFNDASGNTHRLQVAPLFHAEAQAIAQQLGAS